MIQRSNEIMKFMGIEVYPYRERVEPARTNSRAMSHFWMKNPGKDRTRSVDASIPGERTAAMRSTLDDVDISPDDFDATITKWHNQSSFRLVDISPYFIRHVTIDNYIDNDKSIGGLPRLLFNDVHAEKQGDEMFDFLMHFMDAKKSEDFLSSRHFDETEPIEVERKLVDMVIKEQRKKNQGPRIVNAMKNLATDMFNKMPKFPRHDTMIDNVIARERYRMFDVKNELAIKEMFDVVVQWTWEEKYMIETLSKHPNNIVKNLVIDLVKDKDSWTEPKMMDYNFCEVLLDMAIKHSMSRTASMAKIGEKAKAALFGRGSKDDPQCVVRIKNMAEIDTAIKKKWNKL